MRQRAITTLGTAVVALLALGTSSASALPPTISDLGFAAVKAESALLEAKVNPNSKTTKYRFEYGGGNCESNPCTSIPFPEGQLSPSNTPEPVSVEVKGLAPATTYHFRLVAKSTGVGGGESKSQDKVFATFSLPPVFGPCPNDALRQERPSGTLPDCRAYEQASPTDKNGLDAMGLVPYMKASLNGDRVSFQTTNGVPGGEGAQELPSYLSSRGADGWSTQGLLPPASVGTEGLVTGWTPDFSQVFDLATKFGGVGGNTFLARSSEDGSLTTIFPYGSGLERPSYAGASADGSEIFFEAGHNVYLWEPSSGEVSLAGVFNDGTTPAAGAVAGPYNLILGEPAKEGGSRGNYYTQDNHAVTADGSLYFTADGTGQLYLRENPGKEQSPMAGGQCLGPAKACTIHVSASRSTTPDPLGDRAAAFMAATPDGSKAFFTSGQELTDDANTGPEADPPLIQRAPATGPPIAEELPITALGVASDAEHLYWVNSAANAIGRSDLDGQNPDPTFIEIPPHLECPPDPILGRTLCPAEDKEEVPANPQYVAVDSGHIYWTNERSGNKQTGSVGRADLDGEPESVEADWIPGITRPRGIALDDEYVYWGQAGLGFLESSIGRAKKSDGGELNPRFMPNALNPYPGGESGTTPEALAVDANHIYWTSTSNELYRAELADGSNPKFHYLGPEAAVRGIALDSQYLYWASQGKEAIGRLPLADFSQPGVCDPPDPPDPQVPVVPNCESNFIPTAGVPFGLAADGTDLRWSVNGKTPPHPGNDLYRYDAETGDLADLTPDPVENGAEVQGVLGTSDDGSYVYFVANGDLDGAGPASAGDCELEGPGSEDSIQTSGFCSLYLAHQGGQTRFIARLDTDGADYEDDAANWLPRGRSGATLFQIEKTARVLAGGHVLLFRSKEKLTAYDNEGVPMLYRYDADQEKIACISCNPTGAAPSGLVPQGPRVPGIEPLDTAHVLSRIASPDGDRVFFEATDPLVQADVNGEAGCPKVGTGKQHFAACQDVYEWEAKGTGSCESEAQGGGCLYLLSSGKSAAPSFFLDASTSGDDAFILTRSQLVRQDQDQLYDIYDARVGGGFASQDQPPPVPCEAEGCKPAGSTQAQIASPGSASFSGPGDPQRSTPRCPRKRGAAASKAQKRCAARKHHKHRQKKRAAKTKGRAGR